MYSRACVQNLRTQKYSFVFDILDTRRLDSIFFGSPQMLLARLSSASELSFDAQPIWVRTPRGYQYVITWSRRATRRRLLAQTFFESVNRKAITTWPRDHVVIVSRFAHSNRLGNKRKFASPSMVCTTCITSWYSSAIFQFANVFEPANVSTLAKSKPKSSFWPRYLKGTFGLLLILFSGRLWTALRQAGLVHFCRDPDKNAGTSAIYMLAYMLCTAVIKE